MREATPQVLQFDEKQNCHYCVPLEVRDEQIRRAINRIVDRIQPVFEKRAEPIAVVGYGPSLNDTWEKIRDFKYVMTCSGAHRFLIDRGIVPQFHIEVDPRPHKVKLIGEPHKDVEYLIASACHPNLFEHLKHYNVKLWHVFEENDEGMRLLPHGEWALTGGCGAGLRAMTLARFLGFTDLHIFGMDGSEGVTGKHAAAHPMQAPMHALVEYDGVTYKTTPAFLEAAKQTFHELDQMPDTHATFYGEGLVQHMARNYVPNYRTLEPGQICGIAVSKPDLIGQEYARLNMQLHFEDANYGVGGAKWASIVQEIVGKLNTTSVLDYGCGKGHLGRSLPFPIWEYDPAIPFRGESPRPADLVICTDVLEHVEPDKLLFVLGDLKRCTKIVAYIVVHLGAANRTYADGRNTHLICENERWWVELISRFFDIGKLLVVDSELRVLVGPKKKEAGK